MSLGVPGSAPEPEGHPDPAGLVAWLEERDFVDHGDGLFERQL